MIPQATLLSTVDRRAVVLFVVLFVAPGPAERLPMRYQRQSDRERGSISLLLVPAVAGLLIVTVLVILGVGSATNARRGTSTAADAAALAAVD